MTGHSMFQEGYDRTTTEWERWPSADDRFNLKRAAARNPQRPLAAVISSLERSQRKRASTATTLTDLFLQQGSGFGGAHSLTTRAPHRRTNGSTSSSTTRDLTSASARLPLESTRCATTQPSGAR